ncbi:hypothetical protein E2C01_005723 [Portunus trituberculatus]|uniref:Uncharacterized protein n=1 Tax=Portunus trituberculatus TaxID=210409 RepID=A0A5B7CV42_PORTR|nr:hypothetical protein [Portunus trituberculatus]
MLIVMDVELRCCECGCASLWLWRKDYYGIKVGEFLTKTTTPLTLTTPCLPPQLPTLRLRLCLHHHHYHHHYR